MIKPFSLLSLLLVCFIAVVNPIAADADLDNPNARTAQGKVINIGANGAGTLTIDATVPMEFNMSQDTQYFRDGQDIKFTDIAAGHYVTVDYIVDDKGSKKVQSVTVEYDD